jgi:hypothetical protein
MAGIYSAEQIVIELEILIENFEKNVLEHRKTFNFWCI